MRTGRVSVPGAPHLVAKSSCDARKLVAGGARAHSNQPSPLSSLSGRRPLQRPHRQHPCHRVAPRHRRSTRPTQPPMGGVMWLNRLSVDESIKNLGMTVLKSPPHSPKANAICERVIGTIRRECLVDSAIGIALAIDAE